MTPHAKFREMEVKLRKLIWQLQETRDLEQDPDVARKLDQAAAHLWVADDILDTLNLPQLVACQGAE